MEGERSRLPGMQAFLDQEIAKMLDDFEAYPRERETREGIVDLAATRAKCRAFPELPTFVTARAAGRAVRVYRPNSRPPGGRA